MDKLLLSGGLGILPYLLRQPVTLDPIPEDNFRLWEYVMSLWSPAMETVTEVVDDVIDAMPEAADATPSMPDISVTVLKTLQEPSIQITLGLGLVLTAAWLSRRHKVIKDYEIYLPEDSASVQELPSHELNGPGGKIRAL